MDVTIDMSKNKKKSTEKNKVRIDEIDFEKLEMISASNPNAITYAHSRGSAPIKAVDRKHIAKRGIEAMGEQIDIQMQQIMDQMKLLADQVEGLKEKKKLSQIVYGAQMSFKPVIGESYFLYEQDNEYILSILSPEEWGESHLRDKTFICKVRLSGDYSWEIEEQAEKIDWPLN